MAENSKFPEGLTLKERKKELARSAALINDLQVADQRGEVKWGVHDSPLLSPEPSGAVVSFHDAFRFVIPEEYSNIREYIENRLSHKKGEAIGVELGGTGSRLFGGFEEGLFGQTVGIALADRRNEIDPNLKSNDKQRNHNVIVGEILSDETKKEIVEFLGGRKIDLIVERLEGPITSLPDEPYFLGNQADFWYQQLSVGGIMLAQVPPAFINFMPEWEKYIKAEYEGKLDIQYSPQERGTVRLVKLAGAPESLPLLPVFNR